MLYSVLIPQTDEKYLLGSYPNDKSTIALNKKNKVTFKTVNFKSKLEETSEDKDRRGKQILSQKRKLIMKINKMNKFITKSIICLF